MKRDRFRLWHLATGDEQVVGYCGGHTRRLFTWAGVAMGGVAVLTVLSLNQLFQEAFRMDWMSWVVTVIFSLVLLNIFRLTLATIGADVLPRPADETASLFGRGLSFVLRAGFMMALAWFLSVPLTTVVFKADGERIVSEQRAEVQELFARIREQRAALLAQRVADLSAAGREDLVQAAHERFARDAEALRIREQRAADARFFVHRIVGTYRVRPEAYLLSLGMSALFRLPVILKRIGTRRNDHVELTRELQVGLVLDEYDDMLADRLAVLHEQGLWMARFSRYEDPPFNTQEKEGPAADDHEAFTTWFKQR